MTSVYLDVEFNFSVSKLFDIAYTLKVVLITFIFEYANYQLNMKKCISELTLCGTNFLLQVDAYTNLREDYSKECHRFNMQKMLCLGSYFPADTRA